MRKLKISGLDLSDGGVDLLEKMELHPKSILWQERLGVKAFSAERVAAARLEADKEEARVRKGRGLGGGERH